MNLPKLFTTQVKLLTIACVLFISCHSKNADADDEDNSYKDGTYCASVTYDNPSTGTNHTYNLNVEVRNNKLIKILWPNGGWLDDSHFTPPHLSVNSSCSFRSDKGYTYTVKITGAECTGASAQDILEDNRPREFRLSISQCAAAMKMTEEELSEYEVTFNVSRNEQLSEAMCDRMFRYMQDKKELDAQKQTLDNLIENGQIQGTFSVGEPDDYQCQTLIVKRRGHFYLMEVQGRRKVTMGLMNFDPSINGWQETAILEDPAKLVWQVYNMRIVDENTDKVFLDARMKSFCGN